MSGSIKTAALFLMILAVFALGCSGNGASAKQELKVGVVAVTSGELFRKGNYVMTAARYMTDKINNAGGIAADGKTFSVKLYPADSGADAQTAAKAATRMIEQEHVSAIVGATSSDVALAVADVCETHKIPFITPVAGTTRLTSMPYSFRVCYTNKAQGRALAKFVHKYLESGSVGILFSSGSTYSTELTEYFKSSYEKDGGKVVAHESYAEGAREYARQLRSIINSGAKILFLPGNTKKVQLQAAQARKLGFKGTLLGGDSWDPVDLDRNRIFANSYYTDHWTKGLPIEGNSQFEKDFKKKTGADPTELEALTCDAFGSLFEAVKTAGSIKPAAIHQAMVDMPPFHGVTGNIDYNNNGDPDKEVIISTIKDGRAQVECIIPAK
ncbi:ABC transporter substrate-binding protein [Maridesulfovibrio sp.]|uniref:ABC transporter substrate-binding protein n=1 Tax=Maridesulfovibrio sp. TaxID=2795000 RepID=UPI002A18D793|nr:ABC transporter substrate-binding protein [Maridesulfovibrio sp.]